MGLAVRQMISVGQTTLPFLDQQGLTETHRYKLSKPLRCPAACACQTNELEKVMIRISAIPVVAGCLAASLSLAYAQTVISGHREILLQADRSWNGMPYTHYPSGAPQLTMIKLTIAAHTALPWHTHPFPNAGYVLSGELTLQDKQTGKSETFHAGQAFAESVDDVHRGVSGNTPTVLLLTYAGTPGTPTSIPAKGEKPEY
jgi:quercetin dioxygenase-like cupin family protein